jgi:hypothetical protein
MGGVGVRKHDDSKPNLRWNWFEGRGGRSEVVGEGVRAMFHVKQEMRVRVCFT